MGFKDTWKDKVNGEDIVDAADINNIAHAVIQLEDEGRVIEETDPTVPNWAKQPNKPTYSKSEVGLGNVDNVRQYSASNPPPYPVTSVNGKTGAVTVDVPTKLSELLNDSGFITKTVSDLVNYYKKTEVYSRDEIDKKGFLTEHQDISGKLDANKLPEAVNSALAQAKASGDFDGADGKSAYEYAKDGGYTGTEAEFAEKLAFLMEYSVYGYVDKNNNIIIKGNIADGSYIKYEMEDGTTIDIGQLVLDNNVYYSVTSNLTNCTNSNSDTQAIGGESYSATITANSGYELSSVVVTMGGVDITSSAVSGGNISIANVTGNIVITAVAEEVTVEIINLAQPDATASGQTVWESGGWCNDSYMAGSSYAYRSASDGKITTNTIAVEHSDIIYVKGIKYNTGTFPQIAIFDANEDYKKHGYVSVMASNKYINNLEATDDGDYWYFTNYGSNGNDGGVRFIRISGMPSGSINDVIITRNQPIV